MLKYESMYNYIIMLVRSSYHCNLRLNYSTVWIGFVFYPCQQKTLFVTESVDSFVSLLVMRKKYIFKVTLAIPSSEY